MGRPKPRGYKQQTKTVDVSTMDVSIHGLPGSINGVCRLGISTSGGFHWCFLWKVWFFQMEFVRTDSSPWMGDDSKNRNQIVVGKGWRFSGMLDVLHQFGCGLKNCQIQWLDNGKTTYAAPSFTPLGSRVWTSRSHGWRYIARVKSLGQWNHVKYIRKSWDYFRLPIVPSFGSHFCFAGTSGTILWTAAASSVS